MTKDYFNKNMNTVSQWINTYSNSYFNDDEDFLSFFGDGGEKSKKKEDGFPGIPLKDIFHRLEDETIKMIEIHSESRIEITYTDKPVEKFNVFEGSNLAPTIINFLKYRFKSYIHNRYNHNGGVMINLKNIKYEEFPKGSAVSSDVSGAIIFHFKGNDFYFENKAENARKLQWVFEAVPELKTEYLRLIKNRRNFLENEIKKIENAPIFPLTDEDKLLIEVMDD